MDQSTDKLLQVSDEPSEGICNELMNSGPPSINFDLISSEPSSSLYVDDLPIVSQTASTSSMFQLGPLYGRTRHLSCIIENWSESESYNSLPPEINKSNDESFDYVNQQKPSSWEAEDLSDYISTLDESCILDIESLEEINSNSEQQKSDYQWTSSVHGPKYHEYQKEIQINQSNHQSLNSIIETDLNQINAIMIKSGGPVEKYPKIMSQSCYGQLNNPFIDTNTLEQVKNVDATDLDKENEFQSIGPVFNNQAGSRSPLCQSMTQSLTGAGESMFNSLCQLKSMQNSMDSSLQPKSSINPLETSMTTSIQDESKKFTKDTFNDLVDNGKFYCCLVYFLFTNLVSGGV